MLVCVAWTTTATATTTVHKRRGLSEKDRASHIGGMRDTLWLWQSGLLHHDHRDPLPTTTNGRKCSTISSFSTTKSYHHHLHHHRQFTFTHCFVLFLLPVWMGERIDGEICFILLCHFTSYELQFVTRDRRIPYSWCAVPTIWYLIRFSCHKWQLPGIPSIHTIIPTKECCLLLMFHRPALRPVIKVCCCIRHRDRICSIGLVATRWNNSVQ